MTETWVCTACGAAAGEPATKLLDNTYGTQKCLTCEQKRIFHREVDEPPPKKKEST